MINLKGELFTTAWTFGGSALIKLVSSMVLTRLLYPEAFGIITILYSIVFVIEMIADVGVAGLLIRHEDGEKQYFISTLWTVRLFRSWLNGAILFLLAPQIAIWYEVPELALTLQIFSIWFFVFGLESMSYHLAVRRKKTKIVNYTQLFSTLLSTCFAITWSYYERDHFGMIYAAILDRVVLAILSYAFYRKDNPRIHIDRQAGVALWDFAKYVMPSSLITLVVVQFDKLLFLKLFTLEMLGVYGLAVNILAPIQSLGSRICQNILYPRCAENFRNDPDGFYVKYYTENVKLHMLILALPGLLCGAAAFLVDVMYDDRYQLAGFVLQFFAIRAIISTFAATSEDLLFAAGRIRVQFWGNVIRLVWFPPAVILGYWVYDFEGFVFMAMLEFVPTAIYYYALQYNSGLMILRYEYYRLGIVCAAIAIAIAGAYVARIAISFWI